MTQKNSHNVKDANLSKTKALPNGAATTYSSSINLQDNSNGAFLVPCEVEVVAPALTTTQQPDAKTMKYSVQHSSDDSSYEDIPGCTDIITQTGADSSGAATATERVRLPSDVNQYIRLKQVGSASGDASGATGSIALVF